MRVGELVQDLFLESGRYMRDNILKDFPPEFRATTKQSNVSETYDMMTRPDMDKYVFMRVLEDRGAVELDAEGWAAFLMPQCSLGMTRTDTCLVPV